MKGVYSSPDSVYYRVVQQVGSVGVWKDVEGSKINVCGRS